MPSPACSVCRQEFPRTPEFWNKHPRHADGLDTTCKACAKQRAKDWYLANRERASAQRKEYREQNPEQVIERRRRYKEENGDKIRAANLDFYARNREKRIAETAQWRRDNPEKRAAQWKREYETNAELFKQRTKEWRQANPERAKANRQNWRKNNPDARRREYENNIERYKQRAKEWAEANPARRAAIRAKRWAIEHNAPGHFTRGDLILQYEKQRGKCFYCHEDLQNIGSVDHFIPLSKGGTNYPDNIVLACWPCNNRKRAKLPNDFRA